MQNKQQEFMLDQQYPEEVLENQKAEHLIDAGEVNFMNPYFDSLFLTSPHSFHSLSVSLPLIVA